jgi:O-antigen ligase
MRAKPIRLRVGRYSLFTNTINVAVAAAFAVMGGFVIYLANAERMTGGPGFQVAIGRVLTRIFARIEAWSAGVPDVVLGLAVLALAAVFVVATLRDRHRPAPATSDLAADPEPACHHDHDHEPTSV